ncbi:hypothetical protein SAMN05216203_2855 [Marinobacter daqiaonensis]|uniref:Haemolysin activator HlyB C-terminal domain-containing protein n=1 Tax=Marinobacter daqiaonensis TaxID=650891 RepID=A0A1I6JBI4_9GAMM|nr:ShlB/FhaC/HecB family hemolysin secretion/activation protein [Marinobacter daqiaonensis]SFR76274.1 hypothetical protein SAMN05216203_2855 [Marinobacter daqiaonensis]
MWLTVLALMVSGAVETTAATVVSGQGPHQQRTPGLFQESLHYIRSRPFRTEAEGHATAPGPDFDQTVPTVPVIPLSSAPARKEWVGQKFYLTGEDHGDARTDRVRVGFETDGLPGVSNNLALDYNWSTSQQPGDVTMDMGFSWQLPWHGNHFGIRGRFHEYEDEVVRGGAVKEVGGDRQTLELDLTRNLYSGGPGRLDASVITMDVASRWYENGDRTGESRRSYSLMRLDGHLDTPLPWLGAEGYLDLMVEACVALTQGTDQEACGERLGDFQRYNLAGGLTREWLNLSWGMRGEYQYAPDDLPSWRYLQVGSPGMIHGFGGQALRGRKGGWLRLDSETPSRPLWLPSAIRTSLRFSLLGGWADGLAGNPDSSSHVSAAEVSWRVEGERLAASLMAGTLLDTDGPGIASPETPDVSFNLSWSL